MKSFFSILLLSVTLSVSAQEEQSCIMKAFIHRHDSAIRYFVSPSYYLYPLLRVETDKGDRCFATKREAITAGYFELILTGDALSLPTPTPPVTQPAALDVPDGACVTREGYFIAVTPERYEEATKYNKQEDTAALQKLGEQGLIFVTKDGIPVFVEDMEILNGLREFRFVGETVNLWTDSQAIDCRKY